MSLNLAYLVSSPATVICWGWWNEPVSKIRSWTVADIPCGTVEIPYYDSDQGWNIVVWQMGGQISTSMPCRVPRRHIVA